MLGLSISAATSTSSEGREWGFLGTSSMLPSIFYTCAALQCIYSAPWPFIWVKIATALWLFSRTSNLSACRIFWSPCMQNTAGWTSPACRMHALHFPEDPEESHPMGLSCCQYARLASQVGTGRRLACQVSRSSLRRACVIVSGWRWG